MGCVGESIQNQLPVLLQIIEQLFNTTRFLETAGIADIGDTGAEHQRAVQNVGHVFFEISAAGVKCRVKAAKTAKCGAIAKPGKGS